MSQVGRQLIETITGSDPAVRDRSAESLARTQVWQRNSRHAGSSRSFAAAAKTCTNGCAHRSSCTRFTATRFRKTRRSGAGLIPFSGFTHLMDRRYEQAIAEFLDAMTRDGPSGTVASALAQGLRTGRVPDAGRPGAATRFDHARAIAGCSAWAAPTNIRCELRRSCWLREPDLGLFPILVERTAGAARSFPQRLVGHLLPGDGFSGRARVLNISVDLGVHGRDRQPRPPIESRLRVITEPILRLTSIDLNACKDVDSLDELFNFGNDYLGLVKAAVVASGLIPPALEGTSTRLADLLATIVRPGHGLEIVSKVNDIPKGSRLAVSTNLLASLITLMMRATGQVREPDRAAGARRVEGGRGPGDPG